MCFPRHALRAAGLLAALAASAADPGAAQDSLSFFPHDARLAVVTTPVARPLAVDPVPHPELRLQDTSPASDYGVGPPLAGAVAGAAVGLMAGVYLGMQFDTGFHGTYEGEPGPGALMGWALGPAIAIPLGAHFADGGRGNLRHAMAGSLAVAALALPLGFCSDVGLVGVALAPLGELFLAVAGEVASRPR